MSYKDLKDLDDDFLDDSHQVRIDADAVSVVSTASHSSYKEVRAAIQLQEEKLFQNEREIKEGMKKVHIGRINLQEFRELLLNLSLVETTAFQKYLREVQNGGMLVYSKLIKYLCLFDEIDFNTNVNEPRTPQRRALDPNMKTIPTLEDYYSTPPKQTTPSKRFESSNIFSDEYNNQPIINTPSKKQTPKKEAEPIPTIQRSPFQKQVIEEVPTSEVYNQLIRAFLSNSITAKEFLSLLQEKANILPTDKLQKLATSYETGKRVTYSELAMEITLIASKTVHTSVQVQKPSRSFMETTIDIFNPSKGPEEDRKTIPHSKEQSSSLRVQRDVLTWDHVPDEAQRIGKKIGPQSNRVTTDLLSWGDEIEVKKPNPQVVQNAKPKDSLFSWSSDDAEEVRGRRAVNKGSDSVPWGTTDEKISQEFNPHLHHLTKKFPKQ